MTLRPSPVQTLDISAPTTAAPVPARFTAGLVLALLAWCMALAIAWQEQSAALAFAATVACLRGLLCLQDRLASWRAARRTWIEPRRLLQRMNAES